MKKLTALLLTLALTLSSALCLSSSAGEDFTLVESFTDGTDTYFTYELGGPAMPANGAYVFCAYDKSGKMLSAVSPRTFRLPEGSFSSRELTFFSVPSADTAYLRVFPLRSLARPLDGGMTTLELGMFDTRLDYASPDMWAFFGEGEDKPVDLFLVPPTCYGGSRGSNMAISETKTKNNIIGAVNMQKGIFSDSCRLFAPFYRQIGISTLKTLDETEELETAKANAYSDVREAFLYYMATENDGRPVILAGYSQGADMVLRLLKEFYGDKAFSDRLVAAYALGWALTEEEIAAYPQIVPAEGETDTGVVICFNSEDRDTNGSLIVKEGVKTVCINPLSWRTDSEPAAKELNEGAVFLDKEGKVTDEIPNITGGYIDPVRGTLKLTDVTKEEYPAVLNVLEDGCFHYYEYNFFYNNLRTNVAKRVEAYLSR